MHDRDDNDPAVPIVDGVLVNEGVIDTAREPAIDERDDDETEPSVAAGDPDEVPGPEEVEDALEKMVGPHPHLPVADEDEATTSE